MLNKVQLIGFLGANPEIRYTTDQKAIAKFSLATSESWKGKDGQKQEHTEWHNIVIHGKLAEVVRDYLKKGSLVYLEGSIKTRSWEKDASIHYITEIICDSMKMLPSGTKGAQSAEASPVPASSEKQAKTTDGPF